MNTLAVAHAAAATALAQLLPARRGVAWQPGPAAFPVHPDAPTTRLTQHDRTLIVAEHQGAIEVWAGEPQTVFCRPAAVVDASTPDAVAVLAAEVLRSVLPALDNEAARYTGPNHDHKQVVRAKERALIELGYLLRDLGAADLAGRQHIDGPGLHWKTSEGAEWDVLSLGYQGTFTVAYNGPISGLHGLLPYLLRPTPGDGHTDTGSAFTRHLGARFPQLAPVDAHEVDFGRIDTPGGYIALPSLDVCPDHADDSTRVASQIAHVGIDLLLAAASALV
ncbi:hypothetical protein EV284_6406 [Streptomyces sp. BK022]|uniref:hypothetical protein n=1 Tax=Streptomyces sp. BK022 TaxID=2512123 RepID=UPI00102A3665|nr:hypothetical protein [Streptomyces sp. BK022]RZU28240.1 hypothetical protein EV284_6406 [Streptomyces sp. BK022]